MANAVQTDIFADCDDAADIDDNGGDISESDGDDSTDSIVDKEKINPWHKIAEEVNTSAGNQYTEVLNGYLKNKMALSKAKQKAYDTLHKPFLDAFQVAYLNILRFQRALAGDKTNQTIMQTAKRLRDREDFGFDESIRYAVKKRRFLLSDEMDRCFRDNCCLDADNDRDDATSGDDTTSADNNDDYDDDNVGEKSEDDSE